VGQTLAVAPWRIVTWNVRGSHDPDVARLATVLRELRPDAVALQEVRRAQARNLAAALGWRHTWALKHHPYTPLVPWRSEGHAILSAHAISDPVRRTLAPGVSTWTYRHRIALAATIRRGGDPADRLRLYDVHLASGAVPDERIAQARRLADLVRDERAPLPVVAGDLNDAGEVEVVRELRAAGLRDVPGGWTNPARAPRQRLDHVLVPEAAELLDQHEPDGGDDWAELSDHLPVLVELALRDATAGPEPLA